MAMFERYRSIILDGKHYQASELKLLCGKKLNALQSESWEYKLFDFIEEWLNDSPTVIAKTSGTTGVPKGISISKDKMVQSALMTIKYLQIQPNDAALLCLSCEHIAGKMMVVRAIAGNLNLIATEPSSNPLDTIPDDAKIDFAAFVPLQVKEILNEAKTSKQFGNIRNMLIGGAPILPEIVKRLSNFSNNIYETYGMTETISHIALKKLSGIQLPSADNLYFTAMDDVTVKTDSRGCLVIHAPHLFDGSVVTNDVVELKDDKHFRWLGRIDNVVNSGGIKLVPELLEEKISTLIQRRYFFMGKQDEKLSEKLVLVVEGDAFSETELNQLNAELKQYLDKYEIPKEIIFIPEFSFTESGKIQRKINLKIES